MGEQVNTNYFEILPFHGVAIYDIECEYSSTFKKKLLDFMDYDEFQAYLKENEYESSSILLTPSNVSTMTKTKLFLQTEMGTDFFYFLHEYPQFAKTWWWISKFYK